MRKITITAFDKNDHIKGVMSGKCNYLLQHIWHSVVIHKPSKNLLKVLDDWKDNDYNIVVRCSTGTYNLDYIVK